MFVQTCVRNIKLQSVDRRNDCCDAEAEISYSTSTIDSLTRQPIDDIEMKAIFKKEDHR